MKTEELQIKTLRDNWTIANYKEDPMVAEKEQHLDFADAAVVNWVSLSRQQCGRCNKQSYRILGFDSVLLLWEHFSRKEPNGEQKR